MIIDTYFRLMVTKYHYKLLSGYLSLFERASHDWGQGFILLLPPVGVLPGSDAGSDVVKPALSFVIQNHQTLCSMWCPIYGAYYYNVVCSLFSDVALTIW